ncbi:MAG: hypothetical protein CVV64_20655 [Candidatus Wallbacteria bacterium HGW-Wallbacteria-1]|jgi:hypothetical protein|uniref:Uncharacterized protein n=1 Tax=Candidatus Wallbacteria bacterium HGW-Wallbacteria-1 TaxID=2013854 RepID=A0A2N1PI36_9BACT|nr:MAG: hypothetical protein CVV64_20655 [Candidatus Wallbacteria bacterium HGW-Wallbacteria-1]
MHGASSDAPFDIGAFVLALRLGKGGMERQQESSCFSKSIWAERLFSCRSIFVLTRQYNATCFGLGEQLAGLMRTKSFGSSSSDMVGPV